MNQGIHKKALSEWFQELEGNLARRNIFAANIQLMELSNVLGMLDLKPQSLWEPEKVKAVLESLIETEKLDGPVVELGVFRGGGTFVLADALAMLKSKRKVFALDSFEGLDQPQQEDIMPRTGSIHYEKGMFRETSEEILKYVLNFYRHGERVKVVKGFFEDTVPATFAEDMKFSMVIIDPDQYRPTKYCLEWFYPRMHQGGIVLVDDYAGTLAAGVTKAVDEFLADKPEKLIQGGRTMWFMRKT